MRAAITHVRRPVLTVRSADRNDGSAYTPVATGCPRTRGHNAVGIATEVPLGAHAPFDEREPGGRPHPALDPKNHITCKTFLGGKRMRLSPSTIESWNCIPMWRTNQWRI
jgi:hypothetical protein